MAIQVDKIQVPIKVENISTSKAASSVSNYIPKPYLKVARGMEKQYVKFMVDQMNRTVMASTSNSNGENYYKSLLDNERVGAMVNNKGGLGLQKVILDQIYPAKFRNKFAYGQYLNTQKSKKLKQHNSYGPHLPIAMKGKMQIEKHLVKRERGTK